LIHLDSKSIKIINSIMQEKSATSSKQFGLGKVADDIESMPIDPTTLKPNRYPERVLTKNDTKKKNRRRGARGKRAARRRLIGIVTVSALRNLFESTLVAIDPGLYFTRQQSIIIIIFFCFS